MQIRLERVCYKSGYAFLCKNIDWQIGEHEQWIVFGANGSGKTTLLSILAGFRRPFSGEIFQDERPYGDDDILAVRQDIALVSSSFFQNCFHNETALEIVLSALGSGFGLKDDLQAKDVLRAKALLDALGLGQSYASYPFCYLSKGQQQCVLIARALLTKPKVLLLDEVYEGLDVCRREYVKRSLQQLRDNLSIMTVMVTHDPQDITRDFTHALLLKEGKVFAAGSFDEVFQESLVSAYFQTPVDMDWQQDHLVLLPHIQTPLLDRYYTG